MEDPKQKKVILVGGTSYSGSTFFHMALGNDPAGLAIGELLFLFHPLQPHHVNRACSCGDESCSLWRDLQGVDESHVFESIFQLRPDVNFIVDSSKNAFWIARHSENLSRAGIATKHLLIWKSPEEIYSSMKRRGRTAGWENIWINYHLLYFAMVPEWRAVPYSEFVRDPGMLASVCDWAGIPNFDAKEQYWNKTHHIFGGNRTSRFHLYTGTAAERQLQNTFDENRMEFHRQIYYSTPKAAELQLQELLPAHKRERIEGVLETLRQHDVRTGSVPGVPRLKMPKPLVFARRLKTGLGQAYGRWRLKSALVHSNG